ncbi:hypothetical protein ACVILK_002543 [Bradyrhizobium embrapense]
MTSSVRLAGKIEEQAQLEKATFRVLVKPAAAASHCGYKRNAENRLAAALSIGAAGAG